MASSTGLETGLNPTDAAAAWVTWIISRGFMAAVLELPVWFLFLSVTVWFELFFFFFVNLV